MTDKAASGDRRGKMKRASDKLDDAARGRWALPFLFLGSVLESTVFPWPIEFPMIAYMLKGKRATVEVVIIATLGSIAGAIALYFGGRAAFEAIETYLMSRPGLEAGFDRSRTWIDEWGAWAVFLAVLAPIPIQAAAFAAGAAKLPVWAFVIAVAGGRSLRYGAIGLLVYFFGDDITRWWKNQPKALRRWGSIAVVVIFVALFVWAVWSVFFGSPI
ncbi:MAG: VTT domain-containing protein [Oceanicaulis sp.]